MHRNSPKQTDVTEREQKLAGGSHALSKSINDEQEVDGNETLNAYQMLTGRGVQSVHPRILRALACTHCKMSLSMISACSFFTSSLSDGQPL